MSDSHPNPNQDSLPVTIYDTTLRDGAQAEGIHFSLSDKLRVAQRLDEFGVHYIEGGWPGSNEKDFEFFQKAQGLNFRHARLAAFGSTRSPNSQAKVDAQVAALLRAETPVVTLVCKSSELHVTEILRTGLDENLAMIDDTISFLKNHGKEVIFDAEHFFDGFKANAGYTKKCCQVAAEAGAAYVVLCDTNGGSMVEEVYKIT
jgi:2-isopropylmalate synthase